MALKVDGAVLLPVALTCILQVCLVQSRLSPIAARLPLQGEHAKPGSPWPQPSHIEDTKTTLTLDPASFEFISDLSGCDILIKAFDRYRKLTFPHSNSSKASLGAVEQLQVEVKVKDCHGYPQLNMDESYTLSVKTISLLSAQTIWGFLRGMETFSQLVYWEDGTYYIRETKISDSPRFSHRGIMVDTARHYIPMSILFRQLDTMAWNKFNVFHWHIVDDQSFPYVSTTFPELSKMAAFSNKHVYTQDDVATIIEYARLRGIRVIPEFDTPGHAIGWGKAFKYLMTECWANGKPGVANYSDHAAYENLDPTKNETYEFLNKFFLEVKDVFKDDFLHMGMDEAHYMCWQSSPNISDFMQRMGFGDSFPMLERFYNNRLLAMIANMSRRYMVWQDPADHGATLDPDALVHIWKGGKNQAEEWNHHLMTITKMGYNVVFSSCWYLNYISYGEDWRNYYECDPQNFQGTEEQKRRVKGGEACMWGEFVDRTNFLSRFWPRASAVAERLWSPATLVDKDTARWRLDQHRCRMLRRGIPAEPIHPGTCGDLDFDFLEEPQLEQPKPVHVAVCTGSASNLCINAYLFLVIIVIS